MEADGSRDESLSDQMVNTLLVPHFRNKYDLSIALSDLL